MAAKLGLDAKLFYGDAGTTAASELKNVKDLTLKLGSGEADITTRAAEGWRVTAVTLKEASVEFTMLWDPEDTGFTAVKDSYFNNTPVSLFVSDGAGNGLDADWIVTTFDRNEPLEEAITVSVSCKPTFATRAPAWKTAGA